MRVRVRAAVDVALAACAGVGLGGCQLLGIDMVAQPQDGTYDAGREELDASGERSGDASVQPGHDADSREEQDASTDGQDGDIGSSLPREDAMACVANACGGCTALAQSVAARCGACGLGRWACDGEDAVYCDRGDDLPVASSGALMIDDFEDGDSLTRSGDGYTFAFSDQSGGTLNPPDGTRITPVQVGANGSSRSAHVSGAGFTSFGAGLIVRLNALECSFDASSQSGIRFWLKGSASGPVEVSIATSATKDPARCGDGCNDLHARLYDLTEGWTQISVAWSELQQAGWGTAAAFEPQEIQYLQFAFGTDTRFDLYLDELSFY